MIAGCVQHSHSQHRGPHPQRDLRVRLLQPDLHDADLRPLLQLRLHASGKGARRKVFFAEFFAHVGGGCGALPMLREESVYFFYFLVAPLREP